MKPRPKSRRLVFGPGGDQVALQSFRFHEWNAQRDFLWESRAPGVDANDTWADGAHEHPTLEAAVRAVLPDHADFGLDMESAARLLLRLHLVLGTGSPRE